MADPHISPANTVAYQKALLREMGEENVNQFERLYLLPGVAHCGGGQGPSKIDLLGTMVAWVENGVAPDAVMTTSTGEISTFGQPDFGDEEKSHGMPSQKSLGVAPLPDMSRPVYPYPFSAQFAETGNPYDGEHWQKGAAVDTVATRDWPDADFFGKYDFSAK